MAMNIVNSWNEWDPLQEVVVGTARGAADVGFEPALSPYVPAGSQGGRPVVQQLVDEAERQLAPPLARGICCWWSAMRLSRRPWHGGRWTTAPKPPMPGNLYRTCDSPGKLDYAAGPLLTEFEPVFDAACFARCGRDIFWQPDLVSNEFGATWLRRHPGPAFRIHRIGFRELLPTHIDTTLVPVRLGVVLTNPQRPCVDGAIDLFAANGWQTVPAPPSVRSGRSPARDVSNWISMNILMLDARTVVVEQAEKPMMELMRRLGCEVIPCAFDRVYPFGGGFHCCTADIRRAGALQSYFPGLPG
jgi:glycine amidinotransferase